MNLNLIELNSLYWKLPLLWEEANEFERKLIQTKDQIQFNSAQRPEAEELNWIEFDLRFEFIFFQDEFASEDNRGNLF